MSGSTRSTDDALKKLILIIDVGLFIVSHCFNYYYYTLTDDAWVIGFKT